MNVQDESHKIEKLEDEIRQLKAELDKSSEENLRFILNASPIPVVVTHLSDGRALFYNKAAEKLFKLSDWHMREHEHKGILCWLKVRKDVDDCFSKGKAVLDHEFDFKNEADEKHHMTLSATKIFYDGETAILSTFHDLTQETKSQHQLETAKEKAELASIAKSKFLASASHDLRQPLHAMGLLLSVLEGYIVDDRGQNVLARITSSLEAMSELFTGILDVSKLDANVVPVTFEAVRVRDLFETLKNNFAPVAEEKGLEITFVDSSAYVESDWVQLERMLRILIANALRYTETGRVLIGCRRQNNRLGFYVYDTGIGIAPEDQKTIFQEFSQVGISERERHKGLGLGLAICERIAHLLKTEVHLFSEENKGSVFWFSLALVDINDEEIERAQHNDVGLFDGFDQHIE